jgi:hypothetical protein
MLAWKTEGTRLYQALPAQLRAGLLPVEPLREVPAERRDQAAVYETWHTRRTDGPTD